MAMQERIVFQPYVWRKHDKRMALEAAPSILCRTTDEALLRIEKAAAGSLSIAGARAVKIEVDDDTGEYEEPEYIASYGEVPDVVE